MKKNIWPWAWITNRFETKETEKDIELRKKINEPYCNPLASDTCSTTYNTSLEAMAVANDKLQPIVAPSYGTIESIIFNDPDHPGVACSIMIYLSPIDFHKQYFPVSGEVIDVQYDNVGKYYLAYQCKKSKYNEKCRHYIKTQKNGIIRIDQIAGTIARRIEWYNDVGTQVSSGDPLGFIHLGSRVDIHIANKSFKINPEIHKGSKVIGGITVLGWM